MEPGPLPPHERTWRHPSELAPTRVDIDQGSGSHAIAFAGGIVAVMAVAVMVVAMTPGRSSAPMAISATTAPMLLAASGSTPSIAASPAAAPAASVGAIVRPRSAPLLTSFAAFPHAVTAGPQLDLDGSGIATRSPSADDTVFVRTDAVTYRLHWNQVELLDAPDGSVVFDEDGDLIAYVSDGDLIDLVAD